MPYSLSLSLWDLDHLSLSSQCVEVFGATAIHVGAMELVCVGLWATRLVEVFGARAIYIYIGVYRLEIWSWCVNIGLLDYSYLEREASGSTLY